MERDFRLKMHHEPFGGGSRPDPLVELGLQVRDMDGRKVRERGREGEVKGRRRELTEREVWEWH